MFVAVNSVELTNAESTRSSKRSMNAASAVQFVLNLYDRSPPWNATGFRRESDGFAHGELNTMFPAFANRLASLYCRYASYSVLISNPGSVLSGFVGTFGYRNDDPPLLNVAVFPLQGPPT